MKITKSEGVKWRKTGERILVLKTVSSDMTAYNDFKWPESGAVVCPDWMPTNRCGNGLHGLAWGEGDAELLNWRAGAKWLVLLVDPAQGYIELDGKVKFKQCEVVHCGDRLSAVMYLCERGGNAERCVGGTATAGYRGTATAGVGGTATAGDGGTATAGYGGTATAGDGGTATAGDGGTATAGDGGTATAGYRGTATAGDGGTATAGYRGTATAGDGGTATAGVGGTLIFRWYDYKNSRWRYETAYVGEDGIEADVAYVLDEATHKPIKKV